MDGSRSWNKLRLHSRRFCVAILLLSSAVQSCNLESHPDLRVSAVSVPLFSSDVVEEAPLEVIFPSRLSVSCSSNQSVCLEVVGLDHDKTGDVASSSWFKQKQRVGDGFVAAFNLLVEDGTSDGLAFVLQDEKLADVYGGVGTNFGSLNGLETLFAVTFDFCPNRVDIVSAASAATECQGLRIAIVAKKNGALLEVAPSSLSLPDFEEHLSSDLAVKISYLADSKTVKISVGAETELSAQVSFTLPELLGSRFSFVGFSAANSGVSPASFLLESFSLQVPLSDSRVASDLPVTVKPGAELGIRVLLTDTCDQQLSAEDVRRKGISAESFSGNLFYSQDFAVSVPVSEVRNLQDGSFQVIFFMPKDVVASWDLEVFVNGVRSQGSPFPQAVVTESGEATGLTAQTFGLLLALLLLLIIILLALIARYDYYRRQLNEHKEEIGAGKDVKHIEKLEAEMQFVANPLIKDIPQLQRDLRKSIVRLESLKEFNGTQMDKFHEAEQLQKENLKLHKKLRSVKVNAELEDVLDEGSSAGGQSAFERESTLDRRQRIEFKPQKKDSNRGKSFVELEEDDEGENNEGLEVDPAQLAVVTSLFKEFLSRRTEAPRPEASADFPDPDFSSDDNNSL